MSLLTLDILRTCAPRPKPEGSQKARIWDTYVGALTGPDGAKVFADYGIETPQRLVFILANMLQETGGLSLIWESMAYRAAGLVNTFGSSTHISPDEAASLIGKPQEIADRVYGLGNPRKARQLGNTQPGDGWRYRGGGFLQTTGRDNYRTLGQRIGVDLESHPELIEDPIVSLKAACAEWQRGRLNDHADNGSFRACCNGINYGDARRPRPPNGYNDRLGYLLKLLKAFDLPPPRRQPGTLESMHGAAPVFELDDIDPDIEGIRRRLNRLGYDAGAEEGVFDLETRDALLLFQAHAAIPVTGRYDPVTRAALQAEDAPPFEATRRSVPEESGEAVGPSREPEAERGALRAGTTVLLAVAVLGLLMALFTAGVRMGVFVSLGGLKDQLAALLMPLMLVGWCVAVFAATPIRRRQG